MNIGIVPNHVAADTEVSCFSQEQVEIRSLVDRDLFLPLETFDLQMFSESGTALIDIYCTLPMMPVSQ